MRKVVLDDRATLVPCEIASVRAVLSIIMSKSCQHHVITCEFMGENVLGRVFFFGVMWLRGRRSRVFGGFGARFGKVVGRKCAGL